MADDEELLDLARGARATSYAPYSNFRVGAALGTDDDRVFIGANIENAAYPVGLCAERVAVPQAVMAGAVPLVLAIAADGFGPPSPCGMCRQFLYEFAPDLRILATGTDGALDDYLLRDLLPKAFGPARFDPEGTAWTGRGGRFPPEVS